jgi:hypothetical protein
LFSIGIGVLMHQWRKSMFVSLVFFVLFVGSVAINTLGALTSNANPPQVEVLGMEKLSGHEEKYTFMRNWQFLQTSGSKSFIYQTWAHRYVSPAGYYVILAGLILIMGEILLLCAAEITFKINHRTNDQKT